jgi:hypothetical protein
MELVRRIGNDIAESTCQRANPGPWNEGTCAVQPHCSAETGAGAGGVIGSVGSRPEQFGPEHGAWGTGITGMESCAVPFAAGETECAPVIK